MNKLHKRGAVVSSWKPPRDGPKGPGDYIFERGKDEYLELPRELFTVIKPLADYNEQYAMVEAPISVYRERDRDLLDLNKLRGSLHHEKTIVIDRSGKSSPKLTFDVWREWLLHRRYLGLTYAPGEPRDLDGGILNIWNIWIPYPYEGIEGDVSL